MQDTGWHIKELKESEHKERVKEREWGKDKVGVVSQVHVLPSHVGQGKYCLCNLKNGENTENLRA